MVPFGAGAEEICGGDLHEDGAGVFYGCFVAQGAAFPGEELGDGYAVFVFLVEKVDVVLTGKDFTPAIGPVVGEFGM